MILITFCIHIEDIDKHIANGALSPIENSNGYELTALSNSHPYLTLSAYRALMTIGKRFQKALQEHGLPQYTFYVTSALRTEEDQRELRELQNPNASLLTSHRYGTSIDIYYGDYLYSDLFFSKTWRFFHRHLKMRIWEDEIDEILPAWNYQQLAFKHGDKIKAILGRLLIDLQSEGAILVIHEKQEPVFHVTLVR